MISTKSTPSRLAWLLLLTTMFTSGCASWSNPVANGIPVYLVPETLLAAPKSALETVPLSYLRRATTDTHLIGPGDILGVYVEGAIGNERELPPVSFPESESLPPSLGFPIPVRSDGTIPLPLIEPINVKGMTIEEAEKAVKYAYTQNKRIFKEGKQRIIVTIIRPRMVRLLVVRKDRVQQQGFQQIPQYLGRQVMPARRNQNSDGFVIEIPATEADVFTALARSGGLPSDNATNDILIYRNTGNTGASAYARQDGAPERIPFRVAAGMAPPLTESDIILHNGDVLVIDSREPEFYYTAGLLPNREVPLPHGYDLTVTEAIARVGGPLLNGGFGGNNLAGSIVGAGIGNPSPSLVSVLRKTPDGRRVNIRVDLNEAFRDPREDLILLPEDTLVLQETPRESFARYLTGIFSFGAIGDIFDRGDVIGAATLTVP